MEEELIARIEYLEDQLRKVQDRNNRVEEDKAWETSNFRVSSICALTWITIASAFYVIGVERYFINAIVPVIGFYLSTQSLPILRKCWRQKSKKICSPPTVENSLDI